LTSKLKKYIDHLLHNHHFTSTAVSFSIHNHIATMILRLLLSVLSLLALSNAHNIQLKSHSRECFHETLHKDDKMTVTFQVGDREFGGSGNLDVDFWVGGVLCCRGGLG
jgi:hypothetical protein